MPVLRFILRLLQIFILLLMNSLVKPHKESFLRRQESRKTEENTGFPLKTRGNDGKSNVLLLMVFLVILFIYACSRTEDKQQQPVFKQVPQIQEIKPERPAKIKLKRDSKEGYSWEISGDDVEEIIKADKKLRNDLKSE